MKSKKILLMATVVTLITILMPFYIPTAPGLTQNPPFSWMVKVTQGAPVAANITVGLTLNGAPVPIVNVVSVPGYGPVIGLPPGNPPFQAVMLVCPKVPGQATTAALGIITTMIIPNDIHLGYSIDWNGDGVADQVYSCCSYSPQTNPPFTIPFHWELDGPRVPLAPPLLVTFDLDPYPTVPVVQMDKYIVAGGITESCGQLGGNPAWHRGYWQAPIFGGSPFASRAPNLMPGWASFNITFTAPNATTGIVYLTVPRTSAPIVDLTSVGLGLQYALLDHYYWSPRILSWFRVIEVLAGNGYGWLFTGNGTAPVLADVDVLTVQKYNPVPTQPKCGMNTSATYWASFPDLQLSSPKGAGNATLCATRGGFPDVGPDLIPGTADDGFGDGTPDPKGSSVLFLPVKLLVLYDADGAAPWIYQPLFSAPFPSVLTTGTAVDVVDQFGSLIDGCWAENGHPERGTGYSPAPAPHGAPLTGKPWQYCNYLGKWVVGQNKYKSFVTYVTQWSALRVWTALGWIDVNYDTVMTLVKEPHYTWTLGDADLAGLEAAPPFLKVDMMDISMACYAAFSYDEQPPPLDVKIAHPRFDARCDIDQNSKVDMMDISIMCYDFLHQYTDP